MDRKGTRIFASVDFLVYGGYLLLALWVTARLWAHVGSRTPVVNPADHQLGLWFMSHAARVVTNGVHPFYTHQLNVPDGVNLMANTSMLGLAVPMTPVTILFGPLVTWTLLTTISFAGTAAAWYVVFRRTVIRTRLAAAVGAGFCGFAPGLVSHASGQLNWAAHFLLPFVFLAVLRLAAPGRGALRSLVLGLLITYQVFINEEMLLLTAISCGLFVGLYAVFEWPKVRPLVRTFVVRLAGAGTIAVVLLAFPLWFQFFGPGHYRGLPFHPTSFGADLLSYFALASESIAGGPESAKRFTASATEENAFFGPALVMLCAMLAWWLRRHTMVKCAVAVGLFFGVFSLGTTIRVAGRDTGFPGPFRAVSELPFGELLVPTRLSLIVVPVIGFLLAFGADQLLTRPVSRDSLVALRLGWVAAFSAALLPILPTPINVTSLPPVPAFITDGTWREFTMPGRTVVVAPIPYHHAMFGQRWAAMTGSEMAIPAGYFICPTSTDDPSGLWGPVPRPSARLLSDVSQSGAVPVLTASDRADLVADLRHWRAGVVIVDVTASHADALRKVLDELIGVGTQRGGVWMWDVRQL